MKREVTAAMESGRTELAIRMLQLQARTHTIMSATMLSEDQVRRLYRQYCRGRVADRQRGRSPRRIASFLRTLPSRFESSLLAGVLLKHGLIKGRRPKAWLGDPLAYAQRFCQAYTEYLPLAWYAPLSFERAWYFARSLATMTDVSLQHCARCDGHFVRDDTDVRRQFCPLCHVRDQWRAPPVPGRRTA